MRQLHKLLQKLFFSVFILACAPAYAQITPDNTLGTQASRLTPNVLINGVPGNKIDGGAQRGSNLFHSFSQFHVGNGQRVYFGNPVGVENILTRVTGGNASNIFGTLGVDGAANLFLINPNGILFGPNARLDVRGSFVGTTANAIQFGNQGIFSATNPDAPPLLTVQPSALLFNQINQNAAIQNNSIASVGTDPAGFNAFGLRVPDGKSLLLVGGNVSMDRGQLNANGGRVELGGLAEGGTVLLGVDGDNLSLIFPSNVVRADVSLTNQAGILVEGAGGGNIVVNARNLEILGGSFLSAGIGQGLGTPQTVAGDIALNATGEIKVAGSGVVNLVPLGSQGNGGNITIDSGSFSLRDRAQLVASTSGQGNAGNLTVRALDSISLAGGQTTIFSTVQAGGVGKGGNIDINAAKVSLIDGAQLLAITREASDTQPAGQGDAGNVNIKVTGAVDIAGNKNTFPSGIGSTVATGTVGNGGNITIDSGLFSLQDGAQIATSTFGHGNAGNVTVRALDSISLANGNIFSTVERGSVGKGGNININAATLSLKDGAQLLTLTRKASDTQPAGRGDAGNVNVNVTGLVDIAGEKNGFVSAISSRVETGAQGNAGNIIIDSGSFLLRDGASLSAETSGRGNAGNVTVRALDSISLAGASIFSTVEAGGVGKGGNIDINAATLSLKDGSQLLTLTRAASNTQPAARGDAGNVNVHVTGSVDIAGEKNGLPSGIRSRVQTGTVGNGGNITIDSNSFLLQNGALLTAETLGQGNAGTIKVNAADFFTISGKGANFTSGLFVNSQSTTGTAGDIIVTSPKITLNNQAKLNAESASGNGGNIKLNSDLLLLRRGSQISTTAGTTQAGGNGGNVNINSKFIVAVPKENSDITANAFSGTGGNINIRTQGIFGIEPRLQASDQTNDITASSQLGVQGQINIIQPDVQPAQGLVELPGQVLDASNQVAQDCPRGRNAKKPLGKFIVTGRGIPPNPTQPLNGTPNLTQLATLDSDRSVTPKEYRSVTSQEYSSLKPNTSSTPNLSSSSHQAIVEAQGWVKTPDGKIMLVAQAPETTLSSRVTASVCPVSK